MINKILIVLQLLLAFALCSCLTKQKKIVISSYSDGPYVLSNGDSLLVLYQSTDYTFDSLVISKNDIDKYQFECKFDSITCPPLKFCLNTNFVEDKDSILLPNKLIAISDIEGNYEKYYQLLVSNKIIDANYNWVFGDGHLVIVGDLVDRGEYVTQCLWLTYYLEKEATKYGGKVHYLLGNHEQINLLGYDTYCSNKYVTNYKKMNRSIKGLLGATTEVGAWLCNKNAILKAGNLMFVHGGIDTSVLKYGLSIKRINEEIRKDIATEDYRTKESKFLLTDKGVLWYRGLVEACNGYGKITEKELDRILNFYRCKTLVVGHTPVDSVSTDFNGKLIRLDVNHYENSSALYLTNGELYVVDCKGNVRKL